MIIFKFVHANIIERGAAIQGWIIKSSAWSLYRYGILFIYLTFLLVELPTIAIHL